VENKAKAYGESDPTASDLIEQAEGNPFLKTYLLDSSRKARESEYLSRMSDSVIYNLLFAKWTYKECKSKEVNLGLDLKGGMNVMLEVSVPEIIKALAGSGAKDSLFVHTMKLAVEKQRTSQADFVTLFQQAFKEIAPANARLSTIFRKLTVSKTNPTNEDVIKALRDETNAALDKTFFVLRSRIDRFGVAQPNIQRLAQSGRIMIELPGVKEPERVRKLLQGSANLEFWETYDIAELRELFIQINDRLALLEPDKKNTADKKEEEAQIAADTAEVGLPKVEDEGGENLTAEEFAKKNPLFAKLQINDQAAAREGRQDALVGYCRDVDTVEVNRMLNSEIAKSILPQNLKLCWHANTGKTKASFNRLIALKAVGEKGAVLDGKAVEDARQDFTDRAGNEISMSMNQDGANQWKKITEKNKGRCVAIVLDDMVYSYPMVNDVIPNGSSSITGGFTIEEAKDLANLLKAGKLPAPAVIVSEEIVGPTLGKESIDSSMKSFLVAFLLVIIYMVFFYNKSGFVATLALVTNVLFIFGSLASLGAVLTLPGIAGIVLTLGMAVDANVIIYERIKEELRAGKAIRLSIDDGYKAAYSAIIDGNVTTIITGIILLIFGSGPVQGFATTLIIGILTSMFTAIFISRIIFQYMLEKGWNLEFGNKITKDAFAHTKINFLGVRKIFYVVSGTIILISIVSLVTKGLDLGIDFAGGRSYTVRFDKSVKTNEIRNALTAEFGGVAPEVKTFGSDNQIKVTTKWRVNEDNTAVDSMVEARLYAGLKPFFHSEVSHTDFSVQNQNVGLISSSKVGATVSRDITRGAFIAVFFSLIAIFIYIAIRFRNWQYGLGGIASLAHVAIFTLGLYSIFSGILPFTMEIDQTFIAAILTIIGYSINDGVVIFDRIRENRTLYPKRDLLQTMNSSLNSTLGRTINTTGTTAVVLLAIFLLGGEVIRGFVFALFMGVLVGSYSTVFIGTALVYDTSKGKAAAGK
jgi:SecD/SecF fusion protein